MRDYSMTQSIDQGEAPPAYPTPSDPFLLYACQQLDSLRKVAMRRKYPVMAA